MAKLHRVLLISLLLLSAGLHATEEPEPIDEETQSTPAEEGETGPEKPLLDRSRRYLGKGYVDLTQTIDGFLAGKRLDREYNESYLILISQGTWFERSDNANDIKLKGKLDLPHTERRLKLFIDSDPDIDHTLRDRNRSISRGERIRESSSIAGIEFSKDKPRTRWKTSWRLGGRRDDGLRILALGRTRKHWVLNEKWTSYFHQDIWHLDGTGWGETSRVEFTRSLGNDAWIHTFTEIEYQDDDPAWQYIHIWRLDHILSDKHALTYRIGFTGETLGGILQDDRLFSFSWRSLIYKDWVFLHLTPELYFSREDNYKPEGAFTAKLEIFITD